MATSAGPSSGNASLFLGAPNVPTCSLEVQVPAGLPSLAPVDAPNVDAQNAAANATSAPVKTTVAGIRFALPA